MRIFAMLVMTIFLGQGVALAATVNFTDGRVVQGDIIKQDNKGVQINVDGIPMTYYADEIKDIDGKPFGSPSQPAANTASVPAPAPAVPSRTFTPLTYNASAVGMAATAPASSSIDPDKKVLILKFIDVFGTRQSLNNNFKIMLQEIEKEKPDEAQKIRERVKVDEIIDRLLPIYDRNFTSEDLKAFIAFYGSAEGQKLINTIPELMKESVQESVKYMEEKFPEVKVPGPQSDKNSSLSPKDAKYGPR